MIATSGRPGPGADRPAEGHHRPASAPKRSTTRPREHIINRRKQAATHGGQRQAGRGSGRADQHEPRSRSSTSAAARSSATPGRRVRKLADKGNIPCTTTLLGMGAFDEHDPKSAAHARHARRRRTRTTPCRSATCLIAVGARFDDRVTGNLASFAPHAKIIHIDIDPSSISKTVDVDVPVVGDAKLSLELMLPHIEHRDRKEWFAQINAWKKRYPFKYFDDTQERQAAVRDRGDQPPDQGRGDHHDRRRPAPDVGRPVLPLAVTRGR